MTMALIVVATFVFVVLPGFGFILGYLLETEYDFFGTLTPYIGHFQCSNSAVNVLLYAIFNPEMRGMLKRALLCQNPAAVAVVAPAAGPQRGNPALRPPRGNPVRHRDKLAQRPERGNPVPRPRSGNAVANP